MFVLFLYLKKAFDSVPYVSLISKLSVLNLNPVVSRKRNLYQDRTLMVLL